MSTYPILNAQDFAGADMGQQINAAIRALPASGGGVDARGFTGTQAISTDIFDTSPNAKPAAGRLLLPAITINVSASISIPHSWVVEGTGLGGFDRFVTAPVGGTRLLWTGASGGTVVKLVDTFQVVLRY